MVKKGSFAYFLKIQNLYNENNPYHNSTHAADVMLNTNFWFTCELFERYFGPYERFVLTIAGAIHDVGHTGHNNFFHVSFPSLSLFPLGCPTPTRWPISPFFFTVLDEIGINSILASLAP